MLLAANLASIASSAASPDLSLSLSLSLSLRRLSDCLGTANPALSRQTTSAVSALVTTIYVGPNLVLSDKLGAVRAKVEGFGMVYLSVVVFPRIVNKFALEQPFFSLGIFAV